MHAVEGIMARFVPAIPVSINEIFEKNIAFERHRYTQPYVTDTIKQDNRDTLIQPVRTSFDPNEKEVNVKKQSYADKGKAQTYTVHFQNTGPGPYFYVNNLKTHFLKKFM